MNKHGRGRTAAIHERRRRPARGSSSRYAINLEEDVRPARGPIPVIVLSDFDDDDDDNVHTVNRQAASVATSLPMTIDTKPSLVLDRKPAILDDRSRSPLEVSIEDQRLNTSKHNIPKKAPPIKEVQSPLKERKPHIESVVEKETATIESRRSQELNFDIVREVFESIGDYCGFSQQTQLYQICIFTSPSTPWYFGYIQELPASFTLVFGCRDSTMTEAAFFVNCLFIRGAFAALKLGSSSVVDQLISMNTLLGRCLAHFNFQFDDDELARSQTISFMDGVKVLIDFLSIDSETGSDKRQHKSARKWYVTKSPISSAKASCKICGQSGPDLNHYGNHEKEVWSKLSLDQRDQVFDLASDRRRRIRSSLAFLANKY